MANPVRILFIKKQRELYGECDPSPIELSAGLTNSVIWLVQALTKAGITASFVQVVDNNDIDREIARFQPAVVVIEAFWVVPEKFDVLKILHPKVAFVVRNHSEIPFLANEGIAFEWLQGYFHRGVEICCNGERALEAVSIFAASEGFSTGLFWYGPNVYPTQGFAGANVLNPDHPSINVGCFGAVRPFKNQLQQALAAINFGNKIGRSINFNISSTRVEQHGDEALRNIRALFKRSIKHKLIERPWHNHEQFLGLIKSMDISMQVSFTESFNLVSADAVSQGVPVVVGPEVSWLGNYAMVDPTSVDSITEGLLEIWESGPRQQQRRITQQQDDLTDWVTMATDIWTDRFGK
jgi:hypothetical protein